MIKILWNQCEVETLVEDRGMNYQMAQMGSPVPKRIEQCHLDGKEREFAGGHKSIMCETHWQKCTGIVDKDGAKHMKQVTAG